MKSLGDLEHLYSTIQYSINLTFQLRVCTRVKNYPLKTSFACRSQDLYSMKSLVDLDHLYNSK